MRVVVGAGIVVVGAVAVAMAGVAACGLLPAKDGEVVTCEEDWLCGDDVASTASKKFCTDPDDPERAAQIAQFQKDFKETCAGVPETCIGGIAATCQAQCTAKGACDIATAESVTLQ